MYRAQCRWWNDNPAPDQWLRMLVGAKFKLPKPSKTQRPRKDGKPERPIDWASLDAPLTDAEKGIVGPAIPIQG